MKWFRLAAEQGIAKAQSNLGTMYEFSKGVLQDNAVAHMWYNIGAANGNELGGTNRDKIAKNMTPVAIEEAQAMARECMSSNYKKCGYQLMVQEIDPALMSELIALSNRVTEDRLYEIAVEEIERNEFDGVAKALALEEAEGDEKKAEHFTLSIVCAVYGIF